MTLPSYVGRYSVRNEIARGGFALVVQAWDEELESFVAIKILRQELARDEEIQNRFLEEARLLRRIRSAYIVTVHDVGRLNDGCPYFVMDYADRGTLASRLDRFSIVQDLHGITVLADALSNGLSALHEAGVVHRDVKPANLLFQLARRMPHTGTKHENSVNDQGAASRLMSADERILLGDLGIAKDLVKQSAITTVVAGTPLYQAPEQEGANTAVTPAADIYSATAMLWHVLFAKKPPKAGDLEDQLSSIPSVWHDVFRQGMALDPLRRFSNIHDWCSAVSHAVSQQVIPSGVNQPIDVTPTTIRCPYKGLAAYQPEDANYFFGRETLIDELIRRIQLHRVLIVAGPSGSGKSSLVRAGFVPALQAGALAGSDSWRLALFTPGRDPMAELYLQLKSLAPDDRTPISMDDLLAHPTMARHLGWTQGDSRESPLVLCIDQFEELFTLAPAAQRTQFTTALSAMSDPAHSNVRIVIVVRADFYGACAQIPWLAERITDNQVLVGPMTGAELRRAITDPARHAGLHLENNLVDAIVDEAGSETGSLPLVAHALVETWSRRRGNTLTLEGFHEAGGVAGAISQTADSTYEHRFDANERQATKRLFLRLVTPGEGTPDTRRILSRSDIDNDFQPEVMHKVVEYLTEARLLTLDDTTVQIAHEALLRTWPRLRTWIEQSRDDLRTRQRISYAAAEWDAQSLDSDLLYRGTPLLSALEWADKNPDQLGVLEREFLEASEATKAKAEAIAAEKDRKARKNRRLAITVLSLLAIGATVASVIAYLAFRQAQQNEQRAELATVEAHDRFAGALGAAANGIVEEDPLLSLVLGAEATRRAEASPPPFDARAAMVRARRVLAESIVYLLGSPIPAGDAITLALSPDGSLVASGHRDGTIDLIDAHTRELRGTLHGHKGGIRGLDFSPSGDQLVSVGTDGTIRLWSVLGEQNMQGRILGRTDDVVMGVRFHPNGASVVSADGDGAVSLWDTVQTTPPREILVRQTYEFNTVEFSLDGQGLIAGYSDGTIYGWKLAGRDALFEPIRGAHTSNFRYIVMSPSGDRFATANTDGTSKMIHYPSGRIIGQPFKNVARIGVVAFTDNGDYLIGGASDGALKVWDISQDNLVATTAPGHNESIVSAQTNDDHTVLATLGRDQLIRLWSIGSHHPLATEYRVKGGSAKGLAFSLDGSRLASGDDTGIVQIWNLDDDEKPVILEEHSHQVWALAFSPDGNTLASADRSGQLVLWNIESGDQIWSVKAQDGGIWSIVFVEQGKQLVIAGETNVSIWDVKTGTPRKQLAKVDASITRMAVSPDGQYLVTSDTSGVASIWDLATESVTRKIAADDNVLWSVAISPDGQQLATASGDEVVILWEISTGEQQAIFTGHAGGATDVTYLADGVTLVVTDRRGKLHFWDTVTGRRLTETWQGHDDTIWRITVNADGTRFATASDDGLVKVWDEFNIRRACDIGLPAFDETRRRQYLGEAEKSVACD